MKTRHSFFHALCENPSDTFSSQEPGEQILLSLRAHPATLFVSLLASILLLAAPLAFVLPLAQLPLTTLQQTFIVIAWYAFVLSFVLNKLFVWYFNVGVITSRRIIDIDVYNILNSVSTATTLSKVEEVEQKSSGIFSAYFNYGNIYVQTAGENPNIEFMSVPDPSHVIQTINQLMEAHRNEQ